MNRPLGKLRNIGAVTARKLRDAGIDDEQALRQVGAVDAYRRLKHMNPRGTSLVCLYALHGALTDVHWNALPRDLKQKLKSEAG